MKCNECGAEMEDGRKFCRNCGAIFDREGPAAQQPQGTYQQTPPYQPPYQQQPYAQQPYPQQPPQTGYTPYQMPQQVYPASDLYSPTLSVKSILCDLLLLFITGIFTSGIAPLIILIVWATSHKNATKRNFARAALIFMGITIVLTVIFAIIFVAIILASAVA